MSLFPDELSRAVARSLRLEPARWTIADGGYRVARDDGLKVWIANGAWGLHVEDGGRTVYRVTSWVMFGGSPSQQHIWRAISDRARAEAKADKRRLIDKAKALAPNTDQDAADSLTGDVR